MTKKLVHRGWHNRRDEDRVETGAAQVYIYLHKYMVGGLTAGAVKG
jgi:hypothetical protein